jgi:hypothetical protein
MAQLKRRSGSNAKIKNRWGSVAEIDKRIHVGTEAFQALPKRLQHLSAWRRMNSQGHAPVQAHGTLKKTRPSSNLSLKEKLAYVKANID